MFEAAGREKVLARSLDVILAGEISSASRASLHKQIEQPLPDVKVGSAPDEDDGEVPNMRGEGQSGGRRNRAARLLSPSGNPEVFKVVSLVLGTPEFQRQ
jgi:hypothetical protein